MTICETPERTQLQQTAFERFARLKVGAIFLEQGSGKTRLAIDLANFNASRIKHVVWVCPYSVKNTILEELQKWSCRFPVSVVGYETISSSDRAWLELLARTQQLKTFLVADESIFIKNAEAKRTQRLNLLRKSAAYALVLNGTPITKNLWDLKRQMDFLDERIIGMSDAEFASTYFTSINYRKASGRSGSFTKVFEPNVQHLMAKVEPYTLAARLALPISTSERVIDCSISLESSEKYERVKRKTISDYKDDDVSGSKILRLLSVLHRIASTDEQRLRSVAQYINGRQVVFTTYVAEAKILAEILKTPYLVTGKTKERQSIFATWSLDDKPLVMTLGTGAFGLNLQAAHVIHFASLGFDFAKIEQARKRVRRLGQKRDVLIYEHYPAKGISALVQSNLRAKDFLSRLVRREIDLEAML